MSTHLAAMQMSLPEIFDGSSHPDDWWCELLVPLDPEQRVHLYVYGPQAFPEPTHFAVATLPLARDMEDWDAETCLRVLTAELTACCYDLAERVAS
jgi:hypothetical protein